MACPDFLCIGAQKAATSWLAEMLRGHRQVWVPPIKELQFLNEFHNAKRFKWAQQHREVRALRGITAQTKKADPNYRAIEFYALAAQTPISFDWYERLFDFAPVDAVRGELTPGYALLSADAVRSVAERYPNLKIILLIRDPVERAKSSIIMRASRLKLLDNPIALNAAATEIAAEASVVEAGNYQSIIEKWSTQFSENSLLVLLSEELRSTPEACLTRVSEFLGVEGGGFLRDPKMIVHQGERVELGQKSLETIERKQSSNQEWYEQNKEQFSIRKRH